VENSAVCSPLEILWTYLYIITIIMRLKSWTAYSGNHRGREYIYMCEWRKREYKKKPSNTDQIIIIILCRNVVRTSVYIDIICIYIGICVLPHALLSTWMYISRGRINIVTLAIEREKIKMCSCCCSENGA